MAFLIKDYLEHYKMDYTLSVYLPEVAIQNQQVARQDLAKKSGLEEHTARTNGRDQNVPLLIQMLRGFKHQNEELAQGAHLKKAEKALAEQKPSEEEKKESKGKSPFTKPAGQAKDKGPASPPKGNEDDIEEDIIQDVEDIQLQPNSARDHIGTSGGAASSSAVGIDQSIDTLNMGEFDYIEEVRITPRK